MMENTMKMICKILVRLAALRISLDLTGFLFGFLFAILLNTHTFLKGSCHCIFEFFDGHGFHEI